MLSKSILFFISAYLSINLSNALPIPESDRHHHNDHHLHKESKRDTGTCSFPDDLGLVAVNKDGTGNGWAISKDVTCKAGSYCPYACPEGYLSAQWDPSATSYSYPESQYGGLKCNSDGTLSKPFSNKPYCYKGKGTLKVNNKIGKNVAICQTVLPGNEEMLIPTNVGGGSTLTLAVPGTEYWASTAAHYYINPPGVSTDDACTWGSTKNPYGNWSPFVAGVNMDDSQNTFVKIGWNPIWLEDSSPYKNTKPSFGIRIVCEDESKCNGSGCEINPSKVEVNGISKGLSSTGAGGANFCVVTAEQGSTAKIEVFDI
ncbi:uncharacterized protein ASCRUDRAFT_73929 [Ascoidea rubescens DSM 1968]|uniref:SUN-domain-containing protein n=1 Tax=Ascoidea rubescens DSM 1968 TaxID=1344418 RepID=A0A1D2VRQ8_9ASCO|nr:hypothetical protein ASCRUDRAFT_73929 [Ascoidea rubescens DSM 1968]ODV64268.1 hypothetical protein ASCRUDRAFT_73929 [Ascoidea rubescens DSM 1968]